MPIAVIALVVLQRTLHLPDRRGDVKIDYLGATLIAAGVSVLLIWVSFVGHSFAWAVLADRAPWSAAASLVLCRRVWVESRAAEPVVPLRIVRERTTALAILASLAVGMAMFGGAVFLGQYFQIGRGYSPTEAGLLTIPMMAGVLLSSTVVRPADHPDREDQAVHRRRRGRSLASGSRCSARIDHETRWSSASACSSSASASA